LVHHLHAKGMERQKARKEGLIEKNCSVLS